MLWHCWNCEDEVTRMPGKRFEADRPACPHCGADEQNPRHRGLIVPVELVHFDEPDEVLKGRGKNVCLCNGKMQWGKDILTAMTIAVTCPECRVHPKFEEYKKKQMDFTVEQKANFRMTGRSCC